MYKMTKAAEQRIAKELAEFEPDIPVENVLLYLEEMADHDLERKGGLSIQAGSLLIKVNDGDFVKENFLHRVK